MIIVVIYLIIDFAYFFWAGQLQYIFPPEYYLRCRRIYQLILSQETANWKWEAAFFTKTTKKPVPTPEGERAAPAGRKRPVAIRGFAFVEKRPRMW